ncbi:beta-galactosidase-1-like protein 2 [Onthophagus taurus]|uniref:beta-galactosidase-1-like protein 2 n=1 Tax=Onthophagus taurus TaxID=166361 RepID=UPI0039BDD078
MDYFPTVYDYYTKGGIKSGLKAEGNKFELNGKTITIYSGAIHYFRVHPDYWYDRLSKLRAASLICVETYVPWNLHEPKQNLFEFGTSKTDFQEFCNIGKFLEIAKELDLLVIIRPGPYICAEWEFGGLPPWLLAGSLQSSDIRTHYVGFMKKVENYFKKLFEVLSPYQFTNGGPIIAFQIENEYGNVKEKNQPIDTKYLEFLKEIYLKNGIKELLFTSDTPSNGKDGSLPDVLYTANFQIDAKKELDILKSYQPNKPCMVMEFWTGWFDHWGDKHETRRNIDISDTLLEIIQYPASVNFYMFHGGTNWGFMNGANVENDENDNSNIKLDTTSYDYDAPIAENGDYGEKYFSIKELIEKYSKINFNTPLIPFLPGRVAYDYIEITKCMDLDDLLQNVFEKYNYVSTTYMEKLGQNYGYIVYRKTNLTIPKGSILKIAGHVRDTVMVLINHQLISPKLTSMDDLNNFGYWKLNNSTLNLPEITNAVLDIVVENFGRINYGKLYQFNQHKGMDEDQIYLDVHPLRNWTIYPLHFARSFNNSLNPTKKLLTADGPKLYKGILNVDENNKKDTYIDMRDWTKGIVIINGFVLGRYFKFGPQKTLYLPAPFLKNGENVILIFEHFSGSNKISFCKEPIFQ